MSTTGSEGTGNVRRRRNGHASRMSRPNDKLKTSVTPKTPFARPSQGSTGSRSVAVSRYAEMNRAIDELTHPKSPDAKISDLTWMRFCASCQAKTMRERTVSAAAQAKAMPFTVAHGVRQMPSNISTGAHLVADTAKGKVRKLKERIVKRQQGPKPRFQNKVPHKTYQPTTIQATRFKRGAGWMEKMDMIGENFEPVVGRASYARDQTQLQTSGSAFDVIHLLLTGFKEAKAINQIAGDLLMGRLTHPQGTAEMWAVSHRIKMNELRIAQISLQKIINELEARSQPLNQKDANALQAAFRLMAKLEDKAIAIQKEFTQKGSFLGKEELFLLNLDGRNLDELDQLAKDLNQQNKDLNEHLPALLKWIEVRKEEAEIASQVENLGYLDTVITSLRLPNLLADFWKENIHYGLDLIHRATPALHFFNYIALGLTAPLSLISTGFSIYQWVEGEHIINRIDQYLLQRASDAAEGRNEPLDDEMQAIAKQIKTNQDRWVNLLNSVFSVLGTGTFFINLGLIVLPTLIPAIAALVTSIGAGIVITGIAPWFVFVAGLVLTAGTAGILLYRIARYAHKEYRLRKCEYVVSKFDQLMTIDNKSLSQSETKAIEDELSQLLGHNISTLTEKEKADLHHKFRLKLIQLSPEYAIDRFFHRLINEMQSGNSREAFEFIESLNIFTKKELSAIKKSAKKNLAHAEITALLRKRLGT